MTTVPLCATCHHAYPPTRGTQPTCRAYPGPRGIDGKGTEADAGIPDAILLSEADHRMPYPGDHGIQYEEGPSGPGPVATGKVKGQMRPTIEMMRKQWKSRFFRVVRF